MAPSGNVQVVIRVRPFNDQELNGGAEENVRKCLTVEEDQQISLAVRGQPDKKFTFDYVATQDTE